jgi:squalene-hopene/tetraprenyl-beta-curcumene cyclase
MRSRILALLLAGGACLAGALPLRAVEEPTWDREAAARYLDRRMDAWWANAKTLKTGGAETRCLSCHTALPYVWARRALRQAEAATEPTSHERRVLEQVSRRIGYRGDDQPYYDHTEAKKLESRGVEAIVNAVALTGIDGDATASEGQPLVAAAMARMWDVQRSDGAWDWLDFGLEPYEAPDAVFQGATMAAIAAGSPAGRQASDHAAGRAGVTRLRGYLRSRVAGQRAFNRAWTLIAAARLDGVLNEQERTAIVTDLESRQRADGGWSLADLGAWRWARHEAPFAPPGTVDGALLAQSDGYATGLVVYALRRSGRPVSSPAVRKGQQWLVDHQAPERVGDAAWAPWRAYSLNHDRERGGPKGEPWRRLFMSDLATAFGVLALL